MKRYIVFFVLFFFIRFIYCNILAVREVIGSVYSISDIFTNNINPGDKIVKGQKILIKDNNSYIVLDYPDGSEIKIIGISEVSIGDIQKSIDGVPNSFLYLIRGKFFSKVKNSTKQIYRVQTETAVMAVRGTKFGAYFIPEGGGKVLVSEGSVEIFDIKNAFPPVLVEKGYYSSIPAVGLDIPPSQPLKAEKSLFDIFGEEYVVLENETSQESKAKENEKVSSISKKGEIQTKTSKDKTLTTKKTVSASDTNTMKTSEISKSTEKKEESEIDEKPFAFNWVVGADTIDGTVWNKLLLSPEINLFGLTIGLYIPIYYQSLEDLFIPTNWYNKNEWDFTNFSDALNDLLLKFRFIGFKNRNFDIKVGTLNDISLGHGKLIGNYANDSMFPSVRKLGVDFKTDFNFIGTEFICGDLSRLTPIGARLFYRPFIKGFFLIDKLALGLSMMMDYNPIGINNNYVFGYGADVELPILQTPVLNIITYSDIDFLGINNSLSNYNNNFIGPGIFVGIKGNILLFSYILEYRYIMNGFIPMYVNKFYDAKKIDYFHRLAITNNENYNGIFGNIGFGLEYLMDINLNYEQLFGTNTNHINNRLNFSFNISENLLRIGYISFSYDRIEFTFNDFISNIIGNNTLIQAKFYYKLGPAAYFGINYKRYYEYVNNILTNKSTISFETKMGL